MRHADAGIAYRQFCAALIRRGAKLDGDLTFEGEFECIREKIEDDLFPHVAIDIDRLGEIRAIDA